MPEVFQERLITIFDQDKKLGAGNYRLELPDTVQHVICCQHLKENVTKRQRDPALNKYFWKIIKAITKKKFKYHMDQLREVCIVFNYVVFD